MGSEEKELRGIPKTLSDLIQAVGWRDVVKALSPILFGFAVILFLRWRQETVEFYQLLMTLPLTVVCIVVLLAAQRISPRGHDNKIE